MRPASGLQPVWSAPARLGHQPRPPETLESTRKNVLYGRALASRAEVSRVTVRRAVQDLVRRGVLVQRHGSGTFVAPRVGRVEQSLSTLTSFTEDMARRGMTVGSVWLDRGLYAPSPDEMMKLGLAAGENVARVSRLRSANGTPLAIERASLSASVLPESGGI